VDIAGNTLRDFDECFVGAFDFDVFALDLDVANFAVGVVLNGEAAEDSFEFIAFGFLVDLKYAIEDGFTGFG
jgi:hypothetical protein